MIDRRGTMPNTEFLQLIVVAAIAGYVGYLLGRASANATGSQTSTTTHASEPGDDVHGAPIRRASTAPPAGAGSSNHTGDRAPPRRSSAPPPAAAGLMKRED
jgi:hypothetical protein